MLTFNKNLSAVSNGRPNFDVLNAFGNDWNDAGGGGSVFGNTLTVGLFSAGPPTPGPTLGNFDAAAGPIVATDGATWGAQSFPVVEV